MMIKLKKMVINLFIKEYDECIYFNHSYHILRKYEYEKNIKNFNAFPLLINNEFIKGIEIVTPIKKDNSVINITHNKEILQTIITNVKHFTETNDNNYKNLFLDNLKENSEKIGFVNTVDIIIPVLSKIVIFFIIYLYSLMKITQLNLNSQKFLNLFFNI